jgi:hypothetical protein
VKSEKQAERASEIMLALHKFREKLREELPGLTRIELDLTFESGKCTERIKLEVR